MFVQNKKRMFQSSNKIETIIKENGEGEDKGRRGHFRKRKIEHEEEVCFGSFHFLNFLF